MRSYWDYNKLQGVPVRSRLSLGVGETKIASLKIDETEVIMKFEQENPNGSFKDRGIAFQVSYHTSKGLSRFAISSSGNAAVSAAAYCTEANAELDIFISERISSVKLKRIHAFAGEKIRIHKTVKPKSDAIKYANRTQAFNLRGSTDPFALTGYMTIAYELANQLPEIDAVFVPCSSGTGSTGISEGFTDIGKKVQLHICQTARVNPMAREFDDQFRSSDTSLADAIVDKVARRREQVKELVQSTGGSGWVISDTELLEIENYVKAQGFERLSYNSLLSVAGARKAIESGHQFTHPAVILSGL